MDIKQEIDIQETLITDLQGEVEHLKGLLSEATTESDKEYYEEEIILTEHRLSQEQDILTELKEDI